MRAQTGQPLDKILLAGVLETLGKVMLTKFGVLVQYTKKSELLIATAHF